MPGILGTIEEMKFVRREGEMMGNNEIVCYCSNVTKGQIVDAIHEGAKTLDDIKRMTGACTIGRCAELNPKGT